LIDREVRTTKGSSSLMTEQSERRGCRPVTFNKKRKRPSLAAAEAKRKFDDAATEMKKSRDQLGLGEQGRQDPDFKKEDERSSSPKSNATKSKHRRDLQTPGDDPYRAYDELLTKAEQQLQDRLNERRGQV
jgi:hypothetical protein